MSALGYGSRFLGAFVVAISVAIACGGVDKGRILIVDEDGSGGDGSGPGPDGNHDGGTAGTQGSEGGSPGNLGEGGTGGPLGDAGNGPAPVLPEPPVVVSISPDNGASAAEPTDSIRIEFSEGLDPETVTSDSIQVFDGETLVPGTLDYSGVTVEFTPDQRLDLLTEYSVVATTSITDAGGTPMTEDFSSSFKVRDGAWREELLVQNAEGTLNRVLVGPVIDGNGNALVVWGQAKSGQNVNSVFARVLSPGLDFGDPFEIDQTDVACDDISVATNAAGDAIVAWTEKRGSGEEVWVRRLSGGKPTGAAQRIDAAATTVVRTVSAVSATGEAHVFWSFNDTTGGTKQNIVTNHAGPDEAWPSAPQVIYQSADTLSPPAVAFDEDGNGFVFFGFDYSTEAPDGQLYASRYLETSGQWGTNSVAINGSDGIGLYDAPSVVTDNSGGAKVVFAAGQDVKLVTFTKAKGFSTAKAIDDLDAAPQAAPQLSSNGSRFLATWYQAASLTANAYSALSDGAAFAAPELRSNGDYRVGYYGTAVSGVDRHGNALVLFEQGNAANTVDIAFGRLANGSGEWTDGSLVNSLDGQYQDPRVAVAANGVAVAAWSVGIRLSATSIYVSMFE